MHGVMRSAWLLMSAVSVGCGGATGPGTGGTTNGSGDTGGTTGAPTSTTSDIANTTNTAPGGTTGMANGAGPVGAGGQPTDSGMPFMSSDFATPNDAFYRVDVFQLQAPDLVLKPLGVDVTITGQMQAEIDNSLTNDLEPDNNGNGEVGDPEDGDGYIDLNLLFRFYGGLDPVGAGGIASIGSGFCPEPYDGSQLCVPWDVESFQAPLDYVVGTDCVLKDTTLTAPGACIQTVRGRVSLEVQLIGQVPLQDAQMVVSIEGDRLTRGYVRGFLSQTVALSTLLPEELPLLATQLGIEPGTALDEFLPYRQKEAHEGEEGWWFLVGVEAGPAQFDDNGVYMSTKLTVHAADSHAPN